MKQDKFYKNLESNAFFERWILNSKDKKNTKLLRDNKKSIYKQLNQNLILDNLKVLEVGCFIGDLLNYLKKKHNCSVTGIEPSSKACKFGKNKFNLKILNTTFLENSLFYITKQNKNKFDLIIFDDVLSWIERDLILQSLSSANWILKDEGYIYLRDFTPNNYFAVKNHHWPNKEIYNFKQMNGHKEILLKTGKYIEIFNNTYQTKNLQKIKAKNLQSTIWSDTILKKIKKFTHPIIEL